MEGKVPEKSIMDIKPTSLPVVYKTAKDLETEFIRLSPLDVKKVYYSSLTSDDDQRYCFRMKYVHQGHWCMYIAYWEQDILDHKFVRSKPPFKYNVHVYSSYWSDFNSLNININQLYYNTWMLAYSFCHSNLHPDLKIKIRQVEIQISPMIQLPNPFMQELSSGDHRCVTLTGRDSSKVVVLQSVLESCSDAFSRMLAGDWLEKKERCVEIDLDNEGLREFRSYMYSYITPKDCAAQLFPVAHMYHIEHLKFVCAGRLRDEVTSGNANAMEVMALASQYKYKPLMAAVWLYWEEHRYEIGL